MDGRADFGNELERARGGLAEARERREEIELAWVLCSALWRATSEPEAWSGGHGHWRGLAACAEYLALLPQDLEAIAHPDALEHRVEQLLLEASNREKGVRWRVHQAARLEGLHAAWRCGGQELPSAALASVDEACAREGFQRPPQRALRSAWRRRLLERDLELWSFSETCAEALRTLCSQQQREIAARIRSLSAFGRTAKVRRAVQELERQRGAWSPDRLRNVLRAR